MKSQGQVFLSYQCERLGRNVSGISPLKKKYLRTLNVLNSDR